MDRFFLSALPPVVMENLSWWIAGIIVVVGLLVIGLRDLLRFSLSRVWAISSVCFAESMRRRVLWITPLAIAGVVIVSQLQKPLDEQDAILQTIKFCLFATGLLVTIATIILACTNLPREIDNRVIYTIVTKPTTRLELVLGKIVGFARVSGMILLIMGLFTWGYLHLRAWNLRKDIQARLDAGLVDANNVATLEHYARPGGLLTAKTFKEADRLDIYARLPEGGDGAASPVRWAAGGAEQDILVPFDIRKSDLVPMGDPTQTPGSGGLVILLNLIYEQRAVSEEELRQIPPDMPPQMPPMPPMPGAPTSAPVQGPQMLSILPVADNQPATTQALPAPRLRLAILDEGFFSFIQSPQIHGPQSIELPPPPARQPVQVILPPDVAARIAEAAGSESPRRFYLQVSGATPGMTYSMGDPAAILVVPGVTENVIKPATDAQGQPIAPLFRGRVGTHGQQLRGPSASKETPVGVYRFLDAQLADDAERVSFELRAGIERSGDEAMDSDEPTRLSVQIRNHQTNQLGEEILLTPESNRRVYFSVPASAVAGGDFDVIFRTHTPGHYVGLWTPPADRPTLLLVSDRQSFAFNLFKSLLIMWLLTILVIVISIFCSTFLSWPIAVVLTLVILLGRWGVEQVGEAALSPGIGNQVANELGFQGSAPARVVSESVENLSRMLKLVSAVLPDISKFPAMQSIEKGMTVMPAELLAAAAVLLGYGLPTLVLAYVFLKNKEVAP